MTKVHPTPFNATIALTSYAWGTRIDMACTYGDWGQSGRCAAAETWAWSSSVVTEATRRSPRGSACPAPPRCRADNTPMPENEIAAVQLVSVDYGKVLLETQL